MPSGTPSDLSGYLLSYSAGLMSLQLTGEHMGRAPPILLQSMQQTAMCSGPWLAGLVPAIRLDAFCPQVARPCMLCCGVNYASFPPFSEIMCPSYGITHGHCFSWKPVSKVSCYSRLLSQKCLYVWEVWCVGIWGKSVSVSRRGGHVAREKESPYWQ